MALFPDFASLGPFRDASIVVTIDSLPTLTLLIDSAKLPPGTSLLTGRIIESISLPTLSTLKTHTSPLTLAPALLLTHVTPSVQSQTHAHRLYPNRNQCFQENAPFLTELHARFFHTNATALQIRVQASCIQTHRSQLTQTYNV